jgi:hypothetical protein
MRKIKMSLGELVGFTLPVESLTHSLLALQYQVRTWGPRTRAGLSITNRPQA